MSLRFANLHGWVAALASVAMFGLVVHLTMAGKIGSDAVDAEQIRMNTEAIQDIRDRQSADRETLIQLRSDVRWIREGLSDSGIIPSHGRSATIDGR